MSKALKELKNYISKEKDEKFKVIFVFQYNNYKNLKDDILVYNLKESIKLLNGKE